MRLLILMIPIFFGRGEEMQMLSSVRNPPSPPIVHLHGGHISSSLCQLGQQMVTVCTPVSLPLLAEPWRLRPRCGSLTSQLGHKGTADTHAHINTTSSAPIVLLSQLLLLPEGPPTAATFIFFIPLFLILLQLTECLD